MTTFVIKLRVRDSTGRDTAQNRLYTCNICNKKFDSGKAYGGHKRIHSMKIIRKQEPPANEVSVQHPDGEPARYIRCSRCPKTFRTEKAFEEHKKTHDLDDIVQPDHPVVPVLDDHNFSSISRTNALEVRVEVDQIQSGTGENCAITDLAKELSPSWGITGKRGQCTHDQTLLPLKKRKIEFSITPSSEKMVLLVNNNGERKTMEKIYVDHNVHGQILLHQEVEVKESEVVVPKRVFTFDLNEIPPIEIED